MKVVDKRINNSVKYLKDISAGEVVSIPYLTGEFYIVTSNRKLLNLNSGNIYVGTADDTICLIHQVTLMIEE